jgi:hypothetical protein
MSPFQLKQIKKLSKYFTGKNIIEQIKTQQKSEQKS